MKTSLKTDADGLWYVVVDGRPTTPRFVHRGPASACADMYESGARRPEYGEPVLITFKNRSTGRTKTVDAANSAYYRLSPYWVEAS